MVKPPLSPPAAPPASRLRPRVAALEGGQATVFELVGAVVMAALVAAALIAAAVPARAELHWLSTHIAAKMAGQ